MNRFTIQPDTKFLGTFRVLDPAGKPITAAIPENMALRIMNRRNQEIARSMRKPDPGHKATIRIVSVIIGVILLVALHFLNWNDSNTYALSHGQENFE